MDLYETFTAAAAPVPQVSPLTKEQLRKAIAPVVSEYLGAVRVKIASLRERIEWLEERRTQEITRLGGQR